MNTTLMGKRLLADCLPNAVQPALHAGLNAGLHSVIHRIAIYSVSLLCMLAIHPAIAAEAGAGKYQSSFNGYKPMTADSAGDWNASNQRVTAGDQKSDSTDHSQHSMPSPTAEPGDDMAGMDHGKMEQTDHTSMHHKQIPSDQIHHEQMHHDHTMPPMPAMEHNDKSGVSHAH